MDEQGIDEYNDAVGSVVAARNRYEAACNDQGEDSAAAQKARGELSHTIEQRDEMRRRHDLAPDKKPERR
jgi:hypothetical protein